MANQYFFSFFVVTFSNLSVHKGNMSTYANDIALLEDLRKGSSSAYSHLYKAYYNMVKFLVLKNSGDDEQANDIFQDTVIALFEKVQDPEFNVKATLKTYVYSIARNLWLKRLRDRKPHSSIDDFEQFIPMEEDEDKTLTERQINVVEHCLEQLGDPCKTLLTKYYYGKKSMDQIATEMEYTNADNAKNQKYRCLKRLKKLARGQG